MMRLFTGIDLPKALKEKINERVLVLQGRLPQLKWVPVQNYHITLKFLGDREKVNCIKESLYRSVKELPSFPVTLAGLGAFPTLRTPRVLWIGVEEGRLKIEEIYARIEEELGDSGIEPEKKSYHPHLTLARVRREIPGRMVEEMENFPLKELTFTADNVTLFQSKLTPSGPVYRMLKSIRLD